MERINISTLKGTKFEIRPASYTGKTAQERDAAYHGNFILIGVRGKILATISPNGLFDANGNYFVDDLD